MLCDFSNEKVVAKYAARMGQFFSSTYPTVQLCEKQVLEIPDVKRNGYTFSDGAQLILAHSNSEINRVSSRSIAFLNRQIIAILSNLGVPDESFSELLHELLQELDCLTSDPDRCMAMLRQNSDEGGILREMAALVQHGFLAEGDHYIAHLLHVYRLCKLKEAKKRAKIPVVKDAHVLRIMDETGTLKQDEVPCQLSDSSHTEESCHVVKGKYLVFRSPVLHPGDARILKAVECSELKHLYNVIVFSSKGSRDVPSMLSGGDHDGDTYSIIWDKRLYPPTNLSHDGISAHIVRYYLCLCHHHSNVYLIE